MFLVDTATRAIRKCAAGQIWPAGRDSRTAATRNLSRPGFEARTFGSAYPRADHEEASHRGSPTERPCTDLEQAAGLLRELLEEVLGVGPRLHLVRPLHVVRAHPIEDGRDVVLRRTHVLHAHLRHTRDSATAGEVSDRGSATTGEVSVHGSATTGEGSDRGSATAGEVSDRGSATTGEVSDRGSATTGEVSDHGSATTGEGSDRGSATAGEVSDRGSATTGEVSDRGSATTGEVSVHGSATTGEVSDRG